jgi:tRNA 2-thiouridine synthesizing protein A
MAHATQDGLPAFDSELDARGLNCPLPVLKTKVLLNRMAPGTVLKVEATDPHARIDFEAYCARTGHRLLHTSESEGVLRFYIRRSD